MTDNDTLMALNKAYVAAVQASDTAWFANHLMDDFLNTAPDGTVDDKGKFLVRIAASPGVTDLRCQDVRIGHFADTAIICARTAYQRADGTPGQGWYTDTWVRRDGTWRCAAAHVSRA